MIYDALIPIAFLLGMTVTFLHMCRENGIKRFSDVWNYIKTNRVEIAIWIGAAIGGLFLIRYGGFEYFGMSLDVINPGTSFGAGVAIAVWVRTKHKKKGAS